MADLHKVKQETFDIARAINIDPKGFERAVDAYELLSALPVTEHPCPVHPSPEHPSPEHPSPVLHMRRPTPGHPRFHYLESWLVPHLDIRLNKFHFFESIEPTQDLYIDIAFIDIDDATTPATWHTRDLYVDVVTHLPEAPSREQSQSSSNYAPGTSSKAKVQVLDLDELGEALLAGYITNEEARRALDSTQRLLDGLHEHGSVAEWLATQGVRL
ncbi:DUF402 domain-containing protein [Corynebacterium macclintockiae]|uniref:DUF402 domain-containing protein n=1 Tax=Corynebacterium macclintockiae TaxID=2913501 RepID=UPI00254C3F54|nr:DUF402 domain-containing protein [Corynebacterium macclintockiae]MDK8891288.1 DUF402 domain-containing protein [Corynebacterium macclintockiae]